MSEALAPADAVEALVAAATQRGIAVTRTSIAKLLYFADLESVRLGLGTLSGIQWRWENYGPFNSHTIYPAIDRCEQAGLFEVEKTTNYFGSREYRYRASDRASASRAGDYLQVIETVVDKFGHMSPSDLKNLSYQTPPMVKVQATGRRDDPLDLSAGQGSAIAASMALGEDTGFDDRDDELSRLPKWTKQPDGPPMRLGDHPLAKS